MFARALTTKVATCKAGRTAINVIRLLLLVTLLSRYQITLASEVDLRIDVAMGAILTLEGEGTTLWIGTSDGLFRWDNTNTQKNTPKLVDEPNGPVYVLNRDGNTLWIGCDKGLFRWDNPRQGKPHLVNAPTGPVKKLYKFKSSLWIGADNGLFLWEDVNLGEPRRLDLDVGGVKVFYPDNSTLWIGTKRGLLRWDDMVGKKPVFISGVGEVTALSKGDSTLLVGTPTRLLRWDDTRQEPNQFAPINDDGISSLYNDTSVLLVGTKGRDLYRYDVRNGQLELIDSGTGFSEYNRSGPILWLGGGVGEDTGLYRWDNQNENKPRRIFAMDTGYIKVFHRSGGTLWIGGAKGLFRLKGLDTKWDAKIDITSKLPNIIYTDHNLLIRWTIGNYELRTTQKEVRSRVIVIDEGGKPVGLRSEVPLGQQEFSLPPLPAGKYTLHVEAVDLHGKTSVSPDIEFQVYSSWVDVCLRVLKWIGFGYGVLNLLALIVLGIAARRSRQAFELLTSPLVRKGSLYFGAALCHIPAARVWVFERYYQQLKVQFNKDRPYVAGNVKRPDGTLMSTPLLIDELRGTPHIWIYGAAGTGKTALLKKLLKTYCAHPTLRKAYKHYGFIPILITLREFGDPVATGDDSTIPKLAQDALRGMGMPFPDKTFFEHLLRRKGFLIALDGLNEVNIDRQVGNFRATSPEVKLVVTSQTTRLDSGLQIYSLPPMTSDFAQSLLTAFLGGERASRAIRDAGESLLGEVKSGYDIRLIQNLVDAHRPLPKNRLDLYDAVLSYASSLNEGQYPVQAVCEFAWNRWKERQRRFSPDAQLTSALIEPLRGANVVVARGTQFEFRHDLMHGYLAACWLARHASSLDITVERLSEEGVWDHSPPDQDLVFPFLAEMISSSGELQRIAQFAADEMSRRERLLLACRESAKNKGWTISINLGETSPDLLKVQ